MLKTIHAFHWLWSSSCQNKRKIFFWLVLKDRLSTRELLQRRNMSLPDYCCVLCSQAPTESRDHLFLRCPFALTCCNTLHLVVPSSADLLAATVSFRQQLGLPFFMEIIVTMFWAIWSVRNDVIFRNILASVERCRSIFKTEFALVILRAKNKFHPSIDLWLEAYV